ncbi:MAG: PQQ-dependent sugar dehydrogenase [Fibrobacteria bacterium]
MQSSQGNHSCFHRIGFAALAAGWLGIFSPSAHAQVADPCLTVADTELKKTSVISTGLTNPMELAIAPDNRIFIIEKVSGNIKVYDPASKQLTTAGKVSVYGNAPHTGLLGIALDPAFAANHFVYVYYTHATLAQHELARFTESGGTLPDASKVILLTVPGIRWNEQHHSAGSLAFGPDGNLFLSTGENVNPNASQGYASTNGSARSEDSQATAANTNDLNGKILRIHPTADGKYTIPAGNLFPTPTAKEKGEIYAMGLRNPIRVAVDSKTGWVYWCEPGPDAPSDSPTRGPLGRDEVNRAKVPGFFGWPYFNADNQAYVLSGAKQDPAHVVNKSPLNTGDNDLPAAQPSLLAYGDNGNPSYFGNSDSRAGIVGGVYRFDAAQKSAARLPPRYDGSLFIMDWGRHWIDEVTFKPDGSVNQVAPFMAGVKPVGPIDMAFGPNGDMFVLEYDGNSLYQVQYTGSCKMDGGSALQHGMASTRKEHGLRIPMEAFVGRRFGPAATAFWAQRLQSR